MKIQSHEIAMQSQHLEYKSILESSMSFETFYDTTPAQDMQMQDGLASVQSQESCLCSYFDNQNQTLGGIIQNLIKMLQERMGQTREENEEVVGYTQLSFYEKYEEYESLDFSTVGKIQTDKGSLDINLNFSMTRSFIFENNIDIYTTFDPLVINLDGDIPDLNSDTFSFDLDNDGKKEQISTLGSGSGFLALDKNNDGEVNQGSELFGTITGNGFDELRAYDEDENSWIDENDSIYESLQVWLKNDDSKQRELVALGEVGIGAIFLDSALSEFTYKTSENQTLGEMKSSGIFLHEDGKVGNISQIDFAARGKEIAEKDTTKTEPLATLLQA